MHDDDTQRFRFITLVYLEHQVGELGKIKKALDESPRDPELIKLWVSTVKEFAERANHLSKEWVGRYPDERTSPCEPHPLARIALDTRTPT